VEGFFSKVVEPYFYESFGFYFYGLSIIVGVYLVVLIGFLVTNILGKKVYEFFERMLIRLPFFKQVYPALKEMAMFLFSRDRMNSQFKKVVIIEYPKKDIYSFGFLTNDAALHISEKANKELCNVFIPSSPSPLTGFAVMIPRKNIIVVDITVEEAFKFIMSGGVVNPR
jgi:uncharacterized membrane protein